MTTVPGFASRSTDTTFRQFPHRDEAAMADIEGMKEPGWSNSQPVDGDASPVTETDSKVIEPETVEDKAVKTPAKKSTPRKRA